jgi:hypothetical protein
MRNFHLRDKQHQAANADYSQSANGHEWMSLFFCDLCNQYIKSCWDHSAATLATEMLSYYRATELHTGALPLAA